jgi:thioredoxin-like negative regulator of GroEL
MMDKSRKKKLEEMLQEDPTDPFLRYGLAMEYANEGKDNEALRIFAELIERSPDYVPAYMQAARTLVRLDRSDEARALYQKGIATARKQGDQHAADEMTRFLEELP